MDTKQLQTWLKNHGYYKGEIDGIAGPQTREALRKAQQYLADVGLYKVAVDGRYGKNTEAAMTTFDKGKRYFNKYGVSFNIYDQNSMNKAVTALRNKGVRQVNLNGRIVNLGDSDVSNQFGIIAKDMIAGVRTKAVSNPTDASAGNSKNFVSRMGSTAYPTAGGGSSYDANDLDNLVMRYAYDKYHGTSVDDKAWGISYNYAPHGKWNKITSLGGTRTLGLTIDSSKYTPEQAAQIARGAGMLNYTYGGKKYQTNLFTGSKYKDLNDFNAQLAALQTASGVQAAQDAYNAEMKRQYTTYGIDHNMLMDKNANQWNSLFGAVPYGYNAESIGAIAKGQQAVQQGQGAATGLGGNNITYRKTAANPNGRFVYNNFNEWRQGRMLANSRYTANGGISPTRAVTSTYSMGFPVAQQMRGQLAYVGARPNATSIDRTNYYDITDAGKGTKRMGTHIYNEVVKNPAAAYRYFQYVYGDRKNGRVTGDRSRAFDNAQASQLATAAGMTPYHLGAKGRTFAEESPIPGVEPHDLWDSLKTFYENGFDENGVLKTDFNYTESGYNMDFDGGNYTARIRKGKPYNAEDYWNVELGSISGGMSAGIGNKGIPHISRFKFGGMLYKYQEGGWLSGAGIRLVDGALWLADVAGMPSHVTNAARDVAVRANNIPIIAADTVWKRLSGQGKTWKEAWKEADTNPSTVARAFEYFPIQNTETNYSEAELANQYDLRRHSSGRKGQITAEGYRHANQGRYAGDIGLTEFFSPTKVNEWSIGRTSGQRGKDGKDYTTDVFAYDQEDTDKVYMKAVKEGTASPVMTLRGFLGHIGAQGYPDGTNSATGIKTKIDTDAQKKAWEKRKNK